MKKLISSNLQKMLNKSCLPSEEGFFRTIKDLLFLQEFLSQNFYFQYKSTNFVSKGIQRFIKKPCFSSQF